MSVESLIEIAMTKAIGLRHRLHRIPELAYEEFETAKTIRAELDHLGIEYVAGVKDAPTATIAVIGDTRKPCIALRADIDALPIVEKTGLAYASTHAGKMHACGHDGHSSILFGVASVLKAIASDLPVCVKSFWQPAEEAGGGAGKLVEAGVLDGRIGPKVSAVFGLHGWPGLPVGTVSTKPGALLAATDNFIATFHGRGCHGAYPIVTAAEAIVNLQQFVSREFDPTDSCVVTVGKFNAGTATNIIPDTATFETTVRTLTPESRKKARVAIERRMRGIASANDCGLDFKWTQGYPPTVNDPAMAEYVALIARKTVGADRYIPAAKSSMGGEDFAYYLEKAPGCFFFIGVAPTKDPYPSLHNDHYDFTDAAMSVGMRMFVELMRNWK
jgi:amidohydrolase